MISLINLKGYVTYDPLDTLSNKQRNLLHIIVVSILTTSLIIFIDPVFDIVFFKNVYWILVEIFLFGFIYARLLLLIRKASSLIHFLLIFIPLFIADLYFESHFIRSRDYPAIWNYSPDSFIGTIQPAPLKFLITLSLDAFLVGPFALWLSRTIACLWKKNSNPKEDETYDAVFTKERTQDELTTLPYRKEKWNKNIGKNILKRIDFDFWILRLLGIFFLAYLAILIVGSLGTQSLATGINLWPSGLTDLMKDTYENPIHHLHTIGKISNFILLSLVAAFNSKIRYVALLIFTAGNLVAALCSFGLYFLSSGDEFLFQSGIVDSAVTVLGVVLCFRSRKLQSDKTNGAEAIKFADRSIADRMIDGFYLLVAVLSSLLFLALLASVFIPENQEGLLGAWKRAVQSPESMLLNSITFAFTTAFISYCCFKYRAHRRIFQYNLTDPILFSSISAFVWWTVFYIRQEEVDPFTKTYVMLFAILGFSLIGILQKLKKIQYNMNLQITSLHPSEADISFAAVELFFSESKSSYNNSIRKIDKFIASIGGRKRALINFPFFILENILCPLLALRPRFSSMDLGERGLFLKKYILRHPKEIKNSAFPELADIAGKIGISIRAISALAFLSSNEGKAYVQFVEAERRDRFSTESNIPTAPFNQIPPLPKNEMDENNFRPAESIPAKTFMANHLSHHQQSKQLQDEYDYIIVGSGAAGAVMAYRLSTRPDLAGKSILLLERGLRRSRNADMNDDEMEMLAKLYKEGGLQQTKKFDMVVLQGETLGGTTVINNAVCLRLPEDIKSNWESQYGISLGHLDHHFDKIGRELNIHPLSQSSINQKVRNKFLKAVNGFNQKFNSRALDLIDPLSVNARNEDGDGMWNMGNKRGKKLSMDMSYIPWAESHGLEVGTQANALKFDCAEHKNASGKHIASCIWIQTEYGIKRVDIREKLIICGGCIASTHLLMRSLKREQSLGQLGMDFSCNYAFPFALEFEDELKAYDGTQITLGAANKKEQFVFETYFNPPASFSLTIPFNFSSHTEVLNKYSHYVNFGMLMKSSNIGKIDKKYNPITGRAFEFNLENSEDLMRIQSAMVDMIRLAQAAGANSIILPLIPGVKLSLADDAAVDKFILEFKNYKLKQADIVLSTAHPQGGNALNGNSGMTGVVDGEFKLKGFENVHVVDASIFPTSIGVNPQWTIMALSSLASEKI